MPEPAQEDNKLVHLSAPLEVVDPAEQVDRARNVAGACKEIAVRCSMHIGESKHVKVEGWQAIAIAHGCVASARDVERVPGGWRAIGEIRRMSDGVAIATAEGFVGEDEPLWCGGIAKVWDKKLKKRVEKMLDPRPEYARRAMAQTRAISRACRSAFAHIIVMMDAGLSTTPAEEMPPDNGDNDKEVSKEPKAPPDDWRKVKIHFGTKEGVALGMMDPKGLRWWLDEWQPKEYKGSISQENLDLRAALDAAKAELDGKKSTGISEEEKQRIIEEEARQAGLEGHPDDGYPTVPF